MKMWGETHERKIEVNHVDSIMSGITPFDTGKPWDATALFSVTNGNYNGDPDRRGMPRQDPETLQGQVSDVCLSHRVRMQMVNTHGQESPNRVLIVPGSYRQDVYALADAEAGEGDAAVKWLLDNYWDVRTLGSVLAEEKKNRGSFAGPIKFSVASNSIDPISIIDMSITTCSPAKDKQKNGEDIGKKTDFGEKFIVPFALFETHIWYIPDYGKKTGITSEDMMNFFRSFIGMFDFDRSTMRGEAALHSLHLFRHSNELRNARFFDIRRLLEVDRVPGVEFPRSIDDYTVKMREDAVPSGIEHISLIDDWA